MQKKLIGLVVAVVLVAVLVTGVVVSNVQGKGEVQVGVVNREVVFTQYMAPPLMAARDEMQAEFDERAAELDEEEKMELFTEYQVRLEALEIEFETNVEDAIVQVAERQGIKVVVDAGAVLHGGIDMTTAVLDALK